MKRLGLALLLVTLLVLPAQAALVDSHDVEITNTTTINNTVNVKKVKKVTNIVEKKALDNPHGIGADVKLIDFKKLVDTKGILDSLNAEYRHDFNNQSYSIFGVLKLDLTWWQ